MNYTTLIKIIEYQKLTQNLISESIVNSSRIHLKLVRFLSSVNYHKTFHKVDPPWPHRVRPRTVRLRSEPSSADRFLGLVVVVGLHVTSQKWKKRDPVASFLGRRSVRLAPRQEERKNPTIDPISKCAHTRNETKRRNERASPEPETSSLGGGRGGGRHMCVAPFRSSVPKPGCSINFKILFPRWWMQTDMPLSVAFARLLRDGEGGSSKTNETFLINLERIRERLQRMESVPARISGKVNWEWPWPAGWLGKRRRGLRRRRRNDDDAVCTPRFEACAYLIINLNALLHKESRLDEKKQYSIFVCELGNPVESWLNLEGIRLKFAFASHFKYDFNWN